MYAKSTHVSLCVAILVVSAMPAFAEDAACAAMTKIAPSAFRTPFHLFMTIQRSYSSSLLSKAAAREGLAGPENTEEIFTGSAVFVKVRGKWVRSPVSIADIEEGRNSEEGKKQLERDKCQALPDETVNGEAAAVYKIHEEGGGGSVDTKVWISKSRHLRLKQISTTNTGSATSTSSGRYDYNNVQAPPGVK